MGNKVAKKAETINDCPPEGMDYTMSFVQTAYPVAEITTEELKKEMDDPNSNFILLDTRTRKEYEVSHIPNAIHVDYDKVVKSKDLISSINETIANHNANSKNEEKKNNDDNNNDENNNIDLSKTNIYCYCSVGWRSAIMVDKLQQAVIDAKNKNMQNDEKFGKDNVSNIKNVRGSIFQWVNTGNDVVSMDNTKVDKVHTYNKLWGQLVNDQNKRVT